jgi:hypothetical protein
MPSSDGKNTPRTGNGVASGNRRRRSPRLLARTVTKMTVSASPASWVRRAARRLTQMSLEGPRNLR